MFRALAKRCGQTVHSVPFSSRLVLSRASFVTAASSTATTTSSRAPVMYHNSILASSVPVGLRNRRTAPIVLPNILTAPRSRGMAVYQRWGDKAPIIVPDQDDSNNRNTGSSSSGGGGGGGNKWWNRFTNRATTNSRAKPGRYRRFFLMAGGGLLVVSLFNIYEVPFSGRYRVILIPRSFELGLGEASYRSMIKEAGRKVLPQHHPATQLVRSVSEAIIAGNKSLPSDLRWEYTVIDSPIPNAMVVPGGKVMVYTGLINALSAGGAAADLSGIGNRSPIQSDTRDLLSVVLAHEIGHAIARHSAEKMTVYAVVVLPAQVALWSILNSPDLASMLTNFMLSLPFSRAMESEADLLGLHLLAESGNISFLRAPEMFVRLHRATERLRGRSTGGRVTSQIDLFATHPSDAKRIKAIEKAIPGVIEAHRHRLPAGIKPRAPIDLGTEAVRKSLPPASVDRSAEQSRPDRERERPFGRTGARRTEPNATGSGEISAPPPPPVVVPPRPAPKREESRGWDVPISTPPSQRPASTPKKDEWDWDSADDTKNRSGSGSGGRLFGKKPPPKDDATSEWK